MFAGQEERYRVGTIGVFAVAADCTLEVLAVGTHSDLLAVAVDSKVRWAVRNHPAGAALASRVRHCSHWVDTARVHAVHDCCTSSADAEALELAPLALAVISSRLPGGRQSGLGHTGLLVASEQLAYPTLPDMVMEECHDQ